MNKKKIYSIIFPNKKFGIFIISIFIVGIISGSLFLTMIGDTDKIVIINQLKDYFNMINSEKNSTSLINSIYINFSYIFLIFVLGLSIIGILVNGLIVYVKGFVIGFTISSLVYVYKLKGILAGIIFLVPHQLINILIIIWLSIYSFYFSYYLFRQIFNKKNNIKNVLNKFIAIFIISIILTFITSLYETYLMANIFKIIIKLFI